MAHLSPARARALALLVPPLLVALFVILFAWPAARLAPRDLPIGVVGPFQATTALAANLDAHGFAVHRYGSADAARAAIADRDIYGAFVAGPDGLTVLTASAASPSVAQLLQSIATEVTDARSGAKSGPRVLDVTPTGAGDPHGAVFIAALFPLVLASMLSGVVIGLLTRPGWWQAATLAVVAIVAGLLVTWVIQGWLGALGGNWWTNASVISLTIFSVAAAVAGAGALIGPSGYALGALVMALIGNPWSGAASAPELLPDAVRITGQLLPAGACTTLLRGTAFFDDAGSSAPLIVLLVWATLGLGAIWAGAAATHRLSASRRAPLVAATPDHDTAHS